MISKKHRLNEYAVKKVLAKRKPFFSSTIFANVLPNNIWVVRIGIVLSGKQTHGSVNRNIFRRHIYDASREYLFSGGYDVVFLAKKGTLLDSKDSTQKAEISRDVRYILRSLGRPPKKQ